MKDLTQAQANLFNQLQKISEESLTSVVFYPKKKDKHLYDELVKLKLLYYDALQDGYSMSPAKYKEY